MRMDDIRFSCSRLVLIIILAGFLHAASEAVWADEMWAVGEMGSVCHYDGSEWRWIVDNNYHYQVTWALSETDIYAAASNGRIYHYDGLSWNVVYEHPGGTTFDDIWAASSSDIFVTGAEGLVLHYNGIEWIDISNPSVSAVNSIYGASTGELFAACAEGVFQYSGTGWEEIPVPEEYDSWAWNAVWCGDAEDVYIASASTVLRWNGKFWISLDMPATYGTAKDIWGVSGEVLYIITEYQIWQYSFFKHIWSQLEDHSTTSTKWVTLCGISADEIYVGGDDPNSSVRGRIQHYEADSWELLYPGFNVRAIHSISGDHVYVAGDYRSFGSFDLGSWSRWTPELLENLQEVWASLSGRVYAVSHEGGVFELDGDSWSEIARFAVNLNSIWGTSDSDIYIAGYKIIHYDGVDWLPISYGTYAKNITDIYGTSSANVYFCGGDWVFRYNGVAMDTIRVGVSAESYLLGIWAYDENNVYACGYDRYWDPYFSEDYGVWMYHPTIWCYNGSEWYLAQPYYPGYYPSPIEYSAIRGAGADCVITTGACFLDFIFDGDDWIWLINKPFRGFDIWGTSRENVYFAASDGVWRYDGVAFECVAPCSLDLYGICGLTDYPTPASLPALEPFLAQNYPNPFNPNTTISFSLSERQRVSVAVYDAAGRLVRVLVDGVMDAGPRDVIWDGKDNSGRGVASGIYFCRLEAGALKETKKMVLIR